MEEETNNLFNISLSDSETDTCSSSETQKIKPPRDFQSETDFQEQKRSWRVKAEDGEIHTTLPSLPLNNPSKPESQTILHAIEELYFLKRYEEARRIAKGTLEGELSREFRGVVEGYLGRCLEKIERLRV